MMRVPLWRLTAGLYFFVDHLVVLARSKTPEHLEIDSSAVTKPQSLSVGDRVVTLLVNRD